MIKLWKSPKWVIINHSSESFSHEPFPWFIVIDYDWKFCPKLPSPSTWSKRNVLLSKLLKSSVNSLFWTRSQSKLIYHHKCLLLDNRNSIFSTVICVWNKGHTWEAYGREYSKTKASSIKADNAEQTTWLPCNPFLGEGYNILCRNTYNFDQRW